jgi:hypothetical protein
MTSDTGEQIPFEAHWQLAKAFFNDRKILSNVHFESVDWISVHRTLHNLPQLFQVWAAKQVLGIAGTINFLAHQDDRSPLCPSCLECTETCKHIAQCSEVRQAAAFMQSMQGLEKWFKQNNTHMDLQSLLLKYL